MEWCPQNADLMLVITKNGKPAIWLILYGLDIMHDDLKLVNVKTGA